ncbi:MAG: acyl-CoA dehydrogenase family protein [Myxococcales bacterium]|nr:acyl-CoA dehydrogenase family protein [Myxococcales bacterium]MCB9712613.1 acyl-CoA dehydrogenase family protein [Myxococcales bacterium]
MDLRPNESQRAVQEHARSFAQRVLAPEAARLDREGGFPRANLAAAAQAGLLGINVPPALGGRGAGVVAYSLAITETARVCAATTVALCVSNMVAEVVTHFGNEEQRRELVPKLCRGELVVGAFALSEPGAGSDPGGMRTKATRTDRGWVIEGSKLWITSGTDAGLFVVWARTSDAPGTRGISTFLVRGDTPGLIRGKPEHKMGLNGSTTTAIDLEGCEVGPEAMLGEEGRGFPVAMMALDGGRIGIASQALGIGLAATETARRVAIDRSRFGRPLGDQQAVQHMLADSATELDAARLLVLRAAWLKERGTAFSREASIAKVFATERSFAACGRAIQVLGAEGYDEAFEVERNYRDVRVTMIYEGTSEVQRIVISRDIMRRFADGG